MALKCLHYYLLGLVRFGWTRLKSPAVRIAVLVARVRCCGCVFLSRVTPTLGDRVTSTPMCCWQHAREKGRRPRRAVPVQLFPSSWQPHLCNYVLVAESQGLMRPQGTGLLHLWLSTGSNHRLLRVVQIKCIRSPYIAYPERLRASALRFEVQASPLAVSPWILFY